MDLNRSAATTALQQAAQTRTVVRSKSANLSLLLVNKRLYEVALRVLVCHTSVQLDTPPSSRQQQLLRLAQRHIRLATDDGTQGQDVRLFDCIRSIHTWKPQNTLLDAAALQFTGRLLCTCASALRDLCVPTACLAVDEFARIHLPSLEKFRVTGKATVNHLRTFDLMCLPRLREFSFDEIPRSTRTPLFCRPTLRCFTSSRNAAATLIPLGNKITLSIKEWG